MLHDHVVHDLRWIGFAITGLIVIPARASLLSIAPHLAQQVGSFGIGYLNIQKGNKPFLFPSTTPTDFNAEEAKLSVNKILETGAEKAYLTHFGEWNHMKEGAEQLLSSIEIMESIRLSAIKSELKDDELQYYCEEKIKEFMKQEVEKRNLPVSINEYLKFDCDINAMGLAFSAKKERKKKTNAPTL
jgi:hypothetical protein